MSGAVDEPSERPATWWRRPLVQALALLGVLAYVPALTASPGRMPADSKLYLYLDPGRLIADAAGSFDPRQFAGWVPHQHISFIWPSGPWFWAFERVGVTDWIAHRLWVGTIMVAAGLGARWCARQLGLMPTAALVAGVWFQVSLYVLPYVSRTSVMLLPWAGLPWIVALTIRATRRPGWRDPALIALVVLTVGAVNATALAMIVPAPVLWLLHAAWARLCTWRAALVVAARTAVLSLAVSFWWMVALAVQGRSGADVLPYSESLADVSYTATSSEVWRGLGYWLFYVRDPYAATTTASLRYLWSTPALLVSFLVPIVGLLSIVWVRWVHRRFAVLLVVVGFVLAVGVHPIDDRSPLMRLLTGDGERGLALALRSSTRALPVMNLGMALSVAAMVGAAANIGWSRRRPTWRFDAVLAVGVCGLVLLNLPGLWTGAFVDPALERDEDPPAAWIAATERLDEDPDGGRVLMLPGTEFGAYRWGYTVDQPLPGLTDRALVTRDLLPLGSPAAMDLVFALDDRFQEGVAEPDSLGPIARLLGVDTVWLTNDVAFDRFRLARPELVRSDVLTSAAVVDVEAFGDPVVNVPDVAMVDERSIGDDRVGVPQAPVELVELDVPGDLARAYTATLLVVGSGDGLVDLAAAGLLPDAVGVRAAADDPSSWPTDIGVAVTDSNRDRARQWRSSQDTHGFTESGGPDDDLLRDVASDARLPVFEGEDVDDQTIAEQRGPVTAVVTSYGEPFAYLPEHRAVMAIDGDPATAWVVGEHADPVGEAIELAFPDGSPTSTVRLRQPVAPGDRLIGEILVTQGTGTGAPTGPPVAVAIDADADGWSQPIELAPDTTRLRVEISRVDGGTPLTASIVAGVGFSEIDLGLTPTVEVVRPPLVEVDADAPWAWVATRWRTDPTDRWRSDPEPALIRSVVTTHDRTVTPVPTVRIDRRAPDADLAALFGWPVEASSRLTGVPTAAGAAAFDGDPATAWTTEFDGAIGASVTIHGVPTEVTSMTLSQPDPDLSQVTAVEVVDRDGTQPARLEVGADGVARIELTRPARAGTIEVRIAEIAARTTLDRRFADAVDLPVAIGEITFDGAPRIAPIREATASLPCTTVAELDGVAISATLSVDGPGWLDGEPVSARPCEPDVSLAAGEHLLRGARDGAFVLDRIVLDDGLTAALEDVDRPAPVVDTVDDDRFGGTYRVDGCEEGCWFVYVFGHNDAWEATVDGADAGSPALLDGGFNGWWIPPSDGPVEVGVRWSAQRPLTIVLVLSALAALLAVALVGRHRWRRRDTVESAVEQGVDATVVRWEVDRGRFSSRSATWWAVAWCVAGALLIGPWGAVWGAIAGLATWITRRRDLAALIAVATVAGVAVFVVVNERRWSPLPDGGWPNEFEAVHALGMFAAVALLIAALSSDDATPPVDQEESDGPDGPAEEPARASSAALPSEP